ncbi:MAG: hypothetical protein JWP89_2806 [Schlesneria sp.]|nr:hypothetical protein [Schlesneria sp.]
MRRWDLFCRVVDNYGDIGICWRLARQLADHDGEGEIHVRLWVDDLESFAKLCPAIAPRSPVQAVGSVEVCHWSTNFPSVDPADVVIEAFACELPLTYIAAMARRPTPPVWINLEYLSAEDWVEDCHLLPSPHPTSPLKKYFFFPGFTSRTGGLLRERDLMSTRVAFDAAAEAVFWQSIGIPPRGNEDLRVSLFCYENSAVPEFLQSCVEGPTPIRVLTAPGAATEQVSRWLGRGLVTGELVRVGALAVHAIPFLSQDDYDWLLWSCDVNFVRGEDSFVRAQWAQRPFVWQIYPQDKDAHFVKLGAFLSRFLHGVSEPTVISDCWQAWNGRGRISFAWPNYVANLAEIRRYGEVWACQLDHAEDLANNLIRFVREQV